MDVVVGRLMSRAVRHMRQGHMNGRDVHYMRQRRTEGSQNGLDPAGSEKDSMDFWSLQCCAASVRAGGKEAGGSHDSLCIVYSYFLINIPGRC